MLTLRNSVTVARQTLTLFVGVRIPIPQPKLTAHAVSFLFIVLILKIYSDILLCKLYQGKRINMSKSSFLPGIVISAVLFIFSVIFTVFLCLTHLLPLKYILLCASLLLIICGGVLLLTRNTKNKVMFILGCLLTVISAAAMIFTFYVLNRVTSTIKNITHDGTETVQLSVFVKNDDAAQNLNDAADYTFCILKTLDRSSIDLTIQKINDEIGKTVSVSEYDNLVEVIEVVLKSENRALVINPEFLDALAELEGFEDIHGKMREIAVKNIEIKDPEENEQDDPNKTGTKKPNGVFQLYISGIDTRKHSLNVRSRSDVNIIATVNTNTHEVLLVTTPRDYYVPLSNSHGIPDKLTHAGIYGVNTSIDTLEMLYDIDIDYYFRVNFDGFQKIIDAIGGVDVYSNYKYESHNVSFQKGWNHLNGIEAMWYARERHALGGGDSQRAKHQMQIIGAVLTKLSNSTAMLENFSELMNSVDGCFQCTMSYEMIAGLVRGQLDTMASWNISSYSVKGTGAYRVPYSLSSKAWVNLPDYSTVETATQLMQAVINGEHVEVNEAQK